MKKFLCIISPALFGIYLACGGSDSPPPPLNSNPQTTTQICYAASAMQGAIQSCQNNIAPLIPVLTQTTTTWNPNDPNNSAATQALMQALNQPSSSIQSSQAPQQIPAPPGCPPQTGYTTDPSSSCQNNLVSAMLLWKSAQQQNGQLAINNPFYQYYLYAQFQQAANQAIAGMNLNPQQQAALQQQLMTVFQQSILPSLGLPPGQSNALTSVLQNPTLSNPLLSSAASAAGVNVVPNQTLNIGGAVAGGGTAVVVGGTPLVNGTTLGSTTTGALFNIRSKVSPDASTLGLSDSSSGSSSGQTSSNATTASSNATQQYVQPTELLQSRAYGLPSSSISRKPASTSPQLTVDHTEDMRIH